MSLAKIVDIIHSTDRKDWTIRNVEAFDSLFGSDGGRYPQNAKADIQTRAPDVDGSDFVQYAAYIHSSNPKSGRYRGLSFVMFPAEGRPCLFGLVVGTDGLAPDEAVLGRPGHARKAQAICSWLNSIAGAPTQVAWAKQDPTRTDLSIPEDVQQEWPEYRRIFSRYGKEVYAVYAPTANRELTAQAAAAFLDLMIEERGSQPLTAFKSESAKIRESWFGHLMPTVESTEVSGLLTKRRYVILQGPPGTGKTKMAVDLLNKTYQGFGRSIQFHANTTYENFVGGLAPVQTSGELGLRFAPTRGFLMEAAAQAMANPTKPYLLHIDEINRADLGKVLGEAIFLLEANDAPRKVDLPYDFGEPFRRQFSLPPNLHILGTMNSADRSIALVDVAVRRRFAFVSLWPNIQPVVQFGCDYTVEAYRKLVSIFIEHASDEAFSLVPGHSYFLESDPASARKSLKVNLAPLLDEYLAQGYVTGFGEPIRSYLQWLRAQ